MTPMETLSTDKRKRAARKRLLAERDALDPALRRQADAAITRRVIALAQFQDAEALVAYVSIGSEVCTTELIEYAWERGKRVCLPRVLKGTRELRWHVVEQHSQLERGAYGIPEPIPDVCPSIDPNEFDRSMALVPALAFDSAGYRLGYGGGFYDGFLAVYRGTSVGLCRRCALMEDLRAAGLIEPHDMPVRMVVSD